jgi:cell division septum initiation protein DivIVA
MFHSPFARAKDLLGVGMAKALLGQRVYMNDRLVVETARLRSRVRDLESMIEDLQNDNDRLRADLLVEIEATRQLAY